MSAETINLELLATLSQLVAASVVPNLGNLPKAREAARAAIANATTAKPKIEPRRHYLLEIQGDIEPELYDPFPSTDERDDLARRLRKDDPDMDNGLFMITATGTVEIESYSGGFFQ